MSGPISLPDLARQINATADRAEAGALMLQVKARLLVAGGTSWKSWYTANLERSSRSIERCLAAAREQAADQRHKSVVTPADRVLAAGLAAKPPEPLEPAEPQGFTDEVAVAAPVLHVVDDIADTWKEPAADAEPSEQDIAEFDVAYIEFADTVADQPPGDLPPPAEPEPAISDPPRVAQKLADQFLQIASPRLREECLLWTEAGCPDWPLFITSREAAAATYDFRELVFNWTNPEVRAVFARWARQVRQ